MTPELLATLIALAVLIATQITTLYGLYRMREDRDAWRRTANTQARLASEARFAAQTATAELAILEDQQRRQP